VKRRLETEADHSLEGDEPQTLPAPKKPKKSERQLLKTIVKMLSPGKEGHDLTDQNPGSFDPTINMEAPRDESNLALMASDGASGPNLNGAVQVTTVAHIPSIQHPVELKKVEQLVQNYEQQATNGAKLKPIASFLTDTARQGLQLRVNARLATANPPECIKKPLMDMMPLMKVRACLFLTISSNYLILIYRVIPSQWVYR